jgi:hypothetical protein
MHKGIRSAFKMVEFVIDWLLHVMVICYWCDVVVLNVHVLTEDKSDDTKDNLYEELKYAINSLCTP